MRSILRRSMAGLLGLLFMLAPLAASAAGPLFVWSDGQGNLHATDRLGDVPEPYFSLYQARLKELEAQGKKWEDEPPPPPRAAPPPPFSPPSSHYTTADEAALRERWHGMMAQWRLELTVATRQVKEAEEHRNSLAMNPLLRQVPQNRDELMAAEAQLQQARDRMLRARLMLLEELPKKAHAEHVPPVYLR